MAWVSKVSSRHPEVEGSKPDNSEFHFSASLQSISGCGNERIDPAMKNGKGMKRR